MKVGQVTGKREADRCYVLWNLCEVLLDMTAINYYL